MLYLLKREGLGPIATSPPPGALPNDGNSRQEVLIERSLDAKEDDDEE